MRVCFWIEAVVVTTTWKASVEFWQACSWISSMTRGGVSGEILLMESTDQKAVASAACKHAGIPSKNTTSSVFTWEEAGVQFEPSEVDWRVSGRAFDSDEHMFPN